MVTPLMLILSSINGDHVCDRPVDIMYMSRADRSVILSEVHRLGKYVCDDALIFVTADAFGNEIVDTTQVCNGKVVDISNATAMLLTRIRECYKVFENSESFSSNEENGYEDVGTDAIILRLEGNPKYVYIYVCEIMESKGLDYNTKIHKLANLYLAVVGHAGVNVGTEKEQNLMKRFELQSETRFWTELLTADMLRHGIHVDSPVTQEDLDTVKRELRSLGLYGFVNPLRMYMDFASARISRKVEVNVSQEVIDYLSKVVRSGGVSI